MRAGFAPAYFCLADKRLELTRLPHHGYFITRDKDICVLLKEITAKFRMC